MCMLRDRIAAFENIYNPPVKRGPRVVDISLGAAFRDNAMYMYIYYIYSLSLSMRNGAQALCLPLR